MSTFFSVVVPVFNEQDSLPILHERLVKVLESIGKKYEIIYVNDASTDRSLEILNRIASTGKNFYVVSHSQRQGQSAAFYSGFVKASGIWLITIDADLQNEPQEIKKLVKYIEKGQWDVAQGVRKKRKDSFMRRISSRIAWYARSFVLKDKTIDVGCSLRVFRRTCLEGLFFFHNFHRFFTYLMSLNGCRIIQVEVGHKARKYGKSKYNNIKRALEGIFDLFGVYWLSKRRFMPMKERSNAS